MNTAAARQAAREQLPLAEVLTFTAEVGVEVITLTRKGLADPEHGFHHISEARALAKIGLFLTSYVRMFEGGP